jgi:hypothetical protein
MMRPDLIRHRLFQPWALSECFEALARGRGAPRSRILAQAVRLHRMSNQLARIERNSTIELESLASFVRATLTVNAPLPPDDRAARAIGRDRFAGFVGRAGQRLAGGPLSLVPGEGL